MSEIHSLENKSTRELLRATLERFGPVPQTMKAIEEMAELIKELSKDINDHLSNNAPVIDEIADVQITLWQMQILYGVDSVQDRIQFKLNRLKERMNH